MKAWQRKRAKDKAALARADQAFGGRNARLKAMYGETVKKDEDGNVEISVAIPRKERE